jgi:hypothetical protein
VIGTTSTAFHTEHFLLGMALLAISAYSPLVGIYVFEMMRQIDSNIGYVSRFDAIEQ